MIEFIDLHHDFFNIALLTIIASVGFLKYFADQSIKYKYSVREAAIKTLVENGFFLAGIELEKIGQIVINIWLYIINQIKKSDDPIKNLIKFREIIFLNKENLEYLYSGKNNFSSSLSKVNIIHGSFYFALINIYFEISNFFKDILLKPEEYVLFKINESRWFLINQYYIFGTKLTYKAAEILFDISNLSLNLKSLKKNKRFKNLCKICEEFRVLYKGLNEKDFEKFEIKLNDLNNWMIKICEENDGFNKI